MWLLNYLRSERRISSRPEDTGPKILILTPLKNAVPWLPTYIRLLYGLTYPRQLISLGFLESDSTDGTYQVLRRCQPKLHRDFRRALMWKRDFAYHVPEGMDRHEESIQVERRKVLARSRNHLLFHALDDEDWVLWLDVDLLEYPSDIIQTLLATRKEIVHPHCVIEYGGPTFDANAWTEHGRYHMDSMRGTDFVRLDAVGGTMLLIKADLHRDGLIFPPFLYGLANPVVRTGRGEVETEGLGIMARDMGINCWGMPDLEIRHQPY
jgi:glycosyltransferase involved in cell wall biosynthesis